jgi:hypothetical protein
MPIYSHSSYLDTPPGFGTWDWFRQEVGRALRDIQRRQDPDEDVYGPNPDILSTAEDNYINSIVHRGASRFYHPEPVGGVFHRWSFLSTSISVPISSDTADYELPDDCGGIIGDFSYSSGDNTYSRVRKTSVESILDRRSVNTTITSHPTLFAERPRGTQGVKHQNWEVLVWPDPNGDYTLKGTMQVEPRLMNSNQQYPYGGTAHTQGLLSAMLATLEVDQGSGNARQADHERLLSASIKSDVQMHRAENLGYNGNAVGSTRGGVEMRKGGYFQNYDPVTLS